MSYQDRQFGVIPLINVNGTALDTASIKQRPPNSSRSSVYSSISTVNSLYSSGNFAQDTEVVEVKDQLEEDQSKRTRLKELFHSSKPKPLETLHKDLQDQHDFEVIQSRLLEEIQLDTAKNEKLDIDWDHVVEIYLFGGRVEAVLEYNLINYLLGSHLESGQLRFQKFAYGNVNVSMRNMLQDVLDQVDEFSGVTNQFKLELEGRKSTGFGGMETFHTLVKYVEYPGFTLPTAQAIFGTWLLSYSLKRDEKNYDDVRIMNNFRKCARMAIVTRKLWNSGYFTTAIESANFTTEQQLALKKVFTKDNDFALSTSLCSIAEYYQHMQGFDVSINFWEANAHLTGDVESCNLAIWDLSDGFGMGNKVKRLSIRGEKRRKYNTKRRIAHLYRILIENGGHPEVGTSWVFKDKYD